MKVNPKLYEAALAILKEHPDQAAAACYLEDGEILTGVSTDSHHDQVGLCAETGPICEAQKNNKKIVASICLSNRERDKAVIVYPPCGICQERLFWFGEDVEVAVPEKGDATKWRSLPLKDVQPYWWVSAKLG